MTRAARVAAVVYDYHPGAESLESRYFPTSVRLNTNVIM